MNSHAAQGLTFSLFSLSLTVAPLFLLDFFSLFFHLVSACPLCGAHFTLKKNINCVNQGRWTYILCFWCQRADELVSVCRVTVFFPFVFVHVWRDGREHRVALLCFLLVFVVGRLFWRLSRVLELMAVVVEVWPQVRRRAAETSL